MPELTAAHFAIFALLFTGGAVLGWIMRGDRSARERIAVNAGWQERAEAREQEQERLAEQNRDLMQAVSEYKAAQKDTAQRLRELSDSLKDAVDRRDELQRQFKDIRSDLVSATRQRDQLKKDVADRDARQDATVQSLRDKDHKIFKLSHELSSWQNRLPPLVEKYRERDREAAALRLALGTAEERIAELESLRTGERTHIEAADREALTKGLDASNDQYEEAAEVDLSDLQDQIADVDEAGFPGLMQAAYPGRLHNNAPGNGAERGVHHRSAARGLSDDLQQIKGVGPAIERTLHDLGIFRFDQIAAISEYDINRIAERLRGFRSRIYREDWIGQARTLHDLAQQDPA